MGPPQVNVVFIILQEKVLPIIVDSILMCLFWLVLVVCSLTEPVLNQCLLELCQRIEDEREISNLQRTLLVSTSAP